MDATAPEIRFLRNIGLLMTYQCQVACPHCIIEAGPQRTEQMWLEEILDWTEQIAAYRDGFIKLISLTGGEPFINLRRLKGVADYADQRGLIVSAVTNAYWASTPKRAQRILEELPSLNMIQVSADKYHQEFIPFERVENAVEAARACRIPYTVAVCTENKDDPQYQALMKRLEEFVEPELIFTAITFRGGRALKQGNGHHYDISPLPPNTSCGSGSSPIIFPDGRVLACIGPILDLPNDHPLVLGNLRQHSLAEILDAAEENAILHAIRLWGPKKIISMLETAGLGRYLPKAYIKDSVCHACYELMAEPAIVDYIEHLACDSEFKEMVAYGRVYYLKEMEMVTRLGLYRPVEQNVAA